MNEFTITESITNQDGAVIRVVGVGGGGGNMINHMIRKNITGIGLIVANTDAQALNGSLAENKIQMGILGAGMVPEKGREAAMEHYDTIKTALKGADMVFISAGLGGGTGTGAAPVVAQVAKEVGALTVAIVTTPFNFEGKKRRRLALEGLEELKKESDSIIVIHNEKLLSVAPKNLGISDCFKMVDDVLLKAVSGISNVILAHGGSDINLDFADVKTVMGHRGLALMGIGESKGNSAAYDAAQQAIQSPLLDNLSINGAMGVLVHFYIHPDYPLTGISEAMAIIEDNADEDAHIMFGTTTDESMATDEVKLTIIATGFEDQSIFEAEPLNIPIQEPQEVQESTQKTATPKATGIDRYKNSTSDILREYQDGLKDDIYSIPSVLRK